ncbi:hypothetical protein [Streptomyces longispororuber]|uniref:hypothetical protein n=1 Tax=Streptomyces longispororuber TaxID=68230 RepID=UPI0036F6A183
MNIISSERPTPELSGVDLAQVALHQAREAAKTRSEGGTRKTKRRPRTTDARIHGREPAGFTAALQGLMADRAWDVPASGGSAWTSGWTSRPPCPLPCPPRLGPWRSAWRPGT